MNASMPMGRALAALLALGCAPEPSKEDHFRWGPALPEGLACLEDLPPESFRD